MAMANIWSFAENENVDVMNIDIAKTFKATGKFFDDVETVTKLFGVKVHPALKPPRQQPVEEDKAPGEEEKQKE